MSPLVNPQMHSVLHAQQFPPMEEEGGSGVSENTPHKFKSKQDSQAPPLPTAAQVIDAVNYCLENRLSIFLQIMQRAPGLQLPAVVGFSVSKLSLNCSRSYCLCSCKSPQETHGFVQNHCVVLVCGLFELVRRCVCVCTVTSLEKVSHSRPVPLCHSLLFLYWGKMTSLKMYVIFKLLL